MASTATNERTPPGAAPDIAYDFTQLLRVAMRGEKAKAQPGSLSLMALRDLYPEELQAFQFCMPDVRVETTNEPDGRVQVTLTAINPVSPLEPIKQLYPAAALLCALQMSRAIREGVEPAPGKDLLALGVSALNLASAPYYGRYVFIRNVLRDAGLFSEFQSDLQLSGMKLNPSHSQQHRYAAIEKRLPGGKQLVDIGCGKATYLTTLAKRYTNATGFEADMATRGEAKHKLKRAGLAHVKVFGAFDAEKFIPDNSHVLMTEVLEHMPLDSACALLRHLAAQRPSLLLLTVPNRLFNRHYGMADDEFRHWDHRWEPTRTEFEELTRGIFDASTWGLHFEGIGDCVEGACSGTLCTVTPAKKHPKPLSVEKGDWLSALGVGLK